MLAGSGDVVSILINSGVLGSGSGELGKYTSNPYMPQHSTSYAHCSPPVPETLKTSTLNPTWTPKVCKIKALMAVIMGVGPLFYILWGFR